MYMALIHLGDTKVAGAIQAVVSGVIRVLNGSRKMVAMRKEKRKYQ